MLTTRFFSETLGILPKGADLIDLIVIPFFIPVMVALFAMRVQKSGQIDNKLHNSLVRLVLFYLSISLISFIANYQRVNLPPAVLFLFGMLEGPILFILLNRLIKDKKKFGKTMSRFINFIVIVEFCAVIFVNIPMFVESGNPDVMSGTFGNNSYQFSVFLIIIGGYFLGKLLTTSNFTYKIYGIIIQIFVLGTFILLQYRSAVPAFFLAYGIVFIMLYGKKFIRLAALGTILALMIYGGFYFVSSQDYKLRYEDLLDVASKPSDAVNYGKVIAFKNTAIMFTEHPQMIVFGSGPGNFISRANYTFTIELNQNITKGVGFIIRKFFGNKEFSSDVFKTHIEKLYYMDALFGSVQLNNPNSSLLAPLAETGFLGFICFGGIYLILIKKSKEYFQFSRKNADKHLLPLATALFMGVLYLIFLAPLDNYLEIGRITLFIWFLFWVVNSLVEYKKFEIKNQIMNLYLQKEKFLINQQ